MKNTATITLDSIQKDYQVVTGHEIIESYNAVNYQYVVIKKDSPQLIKVDPLKGTEFIFSDGSKITYSSTESSVVPGWGRTPERAWKDALSEIRRNALKDSNYQTIEDDDRKLHYYPHLGLIHEYGEITTVDDYREEVIWSIKKYQEILDQLQ